MENFFEPKSERGTCPYCADAPISHNLFYFTSLVSSILDNHILRVTRHAPAFLRNFVDWLIVIFFQILLLLRLARLSDDISRVSTFRSRVVWEEAKRRGIDMKQVILFGKPIDHYRAVVGGKTIFFNSLPIPPHLLNMREDWDDKFVLKREFSKYGMPIPHYAQFPVFYPQKLERIFSSLKKPVIVKPRAGSRGRHTTTNIRTLDEFRAGVDVAKQISSYLVAEEHLEGDVCRATFVNGELMGFYRGSAPHVVGDGIKTILELIKEKDEQRPSRVEKVVIDEETKKHITRAGFSLENVLPVGTRLSLSHRTGRFFGGATREMLDELHPSFTPILSKAAEIVELPVIGFDCIVSDPTQEASSQKWGIIECNTLPFIDLHYYALEGKSKNIAGRVWDLWNN